MKIRIVKDLTKYGPALTIGAEGVARLDKITYLNDSWEMVEVKVPGSYARYLGWEALEIIDKAHWKERERQIRNATYIILYEGPRGGYKGLEMGYMYKGDMHFTGAYNKREAARIIEIANKIGKTVDRKIASKKVV